MKAPEKIFRTTTYLDNDKGKVVWKETPVNGAENIEYIRKDALLEWAKEKEQNAITNIVKLTYKTVIDKIELL